MPLEEGGGGEEFLLMFSGKINIISALRKKKKMIQTKYEIRSYQKNKINSISRNDKKSLFQKHQNKHMSRYKIRQTKHEGLHNLVYEEEEITLI